MKFDSIYTVSRYFMKFFIIWYADFIGGLKLPSHWRCCLQHESDCVFRFNMAFRNKKQEPKKKKQKKLTGNLW